MGLGPLGACVGCRVPSCVPVTVALHRSPDIRLETSLAPGSIEVGDQGRVEILAESDGIHIHVLGCEVNLHVLLEVIR